MFKREPSGGIDAGATRRVKQPVPRALRWRSLALALTVYVLLCASYFLPPVSRAWEQLEILGTVLRFNLRGQQPLDPSIRILGITQQNISTLAEYGEQYPFARDIHAVVLRRLADAGARMVVVDILFSEEGTWDPTEDAALRDAITYCKSKGCDVVMAAGIDVTRLAEGTVVSLVEPAPTIMQAKPALGISNAGQKLSYRLTDQAHFEIEGDSQQAHLGQAAMAYQLILPHPAMRPLRELVPRNTFPINYTGPVKPLSLETLLPEAFDSQSWDNLKRIRTLLKQGASQPSLWALTGVDQQRAHDLYIGRFVFYGSHNSADNDYFNTPFGEMFGVDTIAESFNTLINNHIIRSIHKPWLFTIGFALALIGWQTGLIRPLKRSAFQGGTLLFSLITLTVVSFRSVDFPLAFTTASFAFPFLACTIYGGSVEEAERRKIRATFGRYMSDELVAQLVEDPQLADLGGQELEVAVMFVDIRSYSTLTENLDPHWTVLMLNIFLGAMTQVIRQHHGFVDKYLGDGLLACFGGPVRTAQPARDAVAAALEMLRVLQEDVHPRLERDGLPQLRIGIGIHFGPVVMGNIGSESRMDFTVVGDSVNVAARVEGCTKETGWALLVTREAAQAADGFQFERVGEQQVKGRTQPVELYRPVCAELGDLLRL